MLNASAVHTDCEATCNATKGCYAYVFAPADKQHVMTGRGKAFHAGNQPPFTMEAFFRPPWIYPLMAWIFTMFMWVPNLGPGAVK